MARKSNARISGKSVCHPKWSGEFEVLVGGKRSGQGVLPFADAVGGVFGDAGFGGEPENQAVGDGWIVGHGREWL